MQRRSTPYLLLLPQTALSLIFLIGLITGIIQSLGVIPVLGLTKPTLRYYQEVLQNPDMLSSIGFSIKIAFISASLAVILGVLLSALIVSRQDKSRFWLDIVKIPIIIPHVVAALFVVLIFTQNGLLARLAYSLGIITEQQELPALVYNKQGLGIILGYLWKEIPFVIYFVGAIMSHINHGLGEAAQNLGAGRLRTFFSITLPLCYRSILSCFLIIFVFTLGAYELPLLLGSTTPKALPILAYQEYLSPELRDRPYAMALNCIIILMSLLSTIIYFRLMKQTKHISKKKNQLIN